MLSIAGIEFSYNSHPILSDITLELDRGQILAVLGVNGAGKSTFLKCINRILRVRKGSIGLDGDDVLRMKGDEIARHMGYVPQRYGEEELAVFDAVLLGRTPYVKWKADEKDLAIVETTIQQMGLEALAMRPVRTLSGGEMQKVVLARALARNRTSFCWMSPPAIWISRTSWRSWVWSRRRSRTGDSPPSSACTTSISHFATPTGF